MRVKSVLAFASQLILAATVQAQAVGVPTKPPQGLPKSGRSQPHVDGFVEIAGEPADPGTTVQIVVFRSATVFFDCGQGTTQKGKDYRGVIYDIDIKQTPQCLNPDNRYDFYVNGVHAGAFQHDFSAPYTAASENLGAPEVALKTPSDSGVKLLWIYGQVKDELGRGAPDGTTVTAEARGGAPCKGTGTTKDLYWQPKDPLGKRIGKLGFYFIGLPMDPACVDKDLIFDVWAGGTKPKSGMTAINMHTPPYGLPASANAILRK